MKDVFHTLGESISDRKANEVFQRYLAFFEDNWRPFDDVLPCLDSLKGSRLGIISNGDEDQQRRKLDKMGIADDFEIVVTSGKAGKAKPDPIIFEYACREAGVKPEESVYVGDNLKVDIWGCRSHNMKGIWINRGESSDFVTDADAVVIYDLKDLKAHL